ncbi:JmjC domain-containing protein [Streptomyces sp. NBC_01190]|uniref:JmjC domain-containing protein n=1 Tax=Streptomyces sp. NBC_01190 TaxID=2903767 RepID=UPI00386B9370|nr:cupin domain-containing protein [Streptomyces sp. NBC_01190]
MPAELPLWVGDVSTFFATYWRREPFVFDTAPYAPMDIRDVDAALAGGLLRTPHLEMTTAEERIDPARYTTSREVLYQQATGYADHERVLEFLKGGATLLLRNTEHWHRPTAELVRRMSDELDRRVEAFFFVTPPGGQGLALHRDDADVLLLQVSGNKQWTVKGGPSRGDWQIGKVTEDAGPALLETTLSPGQVLYIPRGYAHSAVGHQGLSLHLSLTVREVGTPHLVRALQRLLVHGLRLPGRPLDDETLLAGAATLIEAVRERIATVEPADLLRSAREAQRVQPLNDHDRADLTAFAAGLLSHGG